MVNKTNPNNANQYVLDPRQKIMWEFYVNPKSETFGNAYQSAVKAKFAEDTAKQITVTPWFLEKTRRLNLLSKAEKVLEEMLDMPVVVVDKYNQEVEDGDEYDEDGERELIVKTEPALVKIKQDTAKFVASTQGKDEGYSTRSEFTGKNGEAIQIDENTREKTKSALSRFLSRE